MVATLEDVSTRLLGGDYDVEGAITPSGDDEIGKSEEFFGRFLDAVAQTLKGLAPK